MSKEYIISVPDGAGFVEYSYIRGGRKYNTHYAYRSMGRLVRCGECVKANTENCSHSYWDDDWGEWRVGYKGDDWFCADGERSSE